MFLETLLLARVDTLLKPASLLAELAVYMSRWRLHSLTLEMQHLYGYDERRRYPKDGYAEDDDGRDGKVDVTAAGRGDGVGVGVGEGDGDNDYESPMEGEKLEGTIARQRRNRDRLTATREALWKRREQKELRRSRS